MFLMRGAAVSALLTGTRYLSANPLGLPIGCQTYPVRKSISTDFAGTMKSLRAAGFTQIELCSPYGYEDFSSLKQYKPQELRRMLNDWELGCISALGADRALSKDGREHRLCEGVRHDADGHRRWGRSTKGTETVDDVKRYVEPFNALSEKAHAAGIVASLHNEGFVSRYIAGKPVYDMMIAELNPATTKLQFQVSTMQEGYNPVTYFHKYPGRFLSMHCQDWVKDPSTKSGFRQVALGKGVVDWKAVFRAARVGGVKNYFVELEEDPALMPQSVPYLKSLNV
jgi:sugar phosphate isomerase/epimerase